MRHSECPGQPCPGVLIEQGHGQLDLVCGLGEKVELVGRGARLQLKRGGFDFLTGPGPPATSGRIEAEEVAVVPERCVKGHLVAAANDDLRIVVLPGLLTQPQVDGPTAGDGRPHTDLAHDVCHEPGSDDLIILPERRRGSGD